MASNFDYAEWLRQAQERLAFLERQRATIDDEIFKLRQGIAGFSPLLGGKRVGLSDLMGGAAWLGADTNLTEAIRQIFRNDGRIFAPTQIRDELLNRGVRLEQANPMSVIHQILSRLAVKGEIVAINVNGKTCHQSKLAASGQFSNNPLAGKKINK